MSQANADTPLSSLDVSVIGDRGDTEEVGYNGEEATAGEMIVDVVTIDTGRSDMNEPAQDKGGYIVERLANNMVDPGLGLALTVASTLDVGTDHCYKYKDISGNKRHTQPPSDWCNLKARVLGEGYLANMVRRKTGIT